MLHEILLSLSGHPSALFHPTGGGTADPDAVTDFPLLSPSEQALLANIAQLSRLHRDLRAHTTAISSSHPSTVCRAVATAVTAVHLAGFQRKILDVEESVLKRDAASVGAYNIVPLAGMVGEFDGWTRLMEWFWATACFMLDPKSGSTCSGSAIIDRLRQEAQTGYPDIEAAALGLGRVAETAWLRQLSTWVLYGRLPTFGAHDFFIRKLQETEFDADVSLLPKFVSPGTASSILFIGKSLNHIRVRRTKTENARKTASELDLLPTHLRHLSSLALPISSPALSSAIAAIRLSLSRNTLQQLLPLPKIINLLTIFREYFLLGKGEFAVSLITEAELHLQSRSKNPPSSKPIESLRGLVIKEAELIAILSKTFSALSGLVEDDSEDQESLDFARSLFRLAAAKSSNVTKRASNAAPPAFNDFLLPLPTALTLELKPPFDLFTTQAELTVYSNLHAYLLSIRRAHMRLGNLWRLSSLRRCHPAPLAPPLSCSEHGLRLLQTRRERANKRNLEMRSTWATCSAAVFLLSEVGNYFEGEVVGGAWADLRAWMQPSPSSSMAGDAPPPPHDPETLSAAHATFLSVLMQALLLADVKFTTALRQLLLHIDALVALLQRLQGIQSALDLEEDEGVVDALAGAADEEGFVSREVGRARSRVDGALKGVVERLRELDVAGGAVEGDGGAKGGFGEGVGEGAYRGWKGGGVERLLMRLDVDHSRERGADSGEELV